jgi:hypothetical protein
MSTLIRHLPWVILGVVVILLVAIVTQVVTSMPPRTFTILTGPEGGGYYMVAQEYQRIAKEKGFDLKIRTTNGASETLELLERGEGDAGFVQGGVAARGNPQVLNTIANVFYEPVWIFYRQDAFGGEPLTRLSQAKGKRIALGTRGSGTRELAGTLLAQAGLTPPNATFLDLSFDEAAEQLVAGEVDVAFFVLADASELPWRLIREPGIELMSMARAGAYAFHYPWLGEVVLPEAGADVALGIPRTPKQLIATTANLVARIDLHPDLVRLLVIAAIATHRNGGRFEEPGQFPNLKLTDLPVDPEAEAYLQQSLGGRAFLDSYFPFWLASLLDRYLLFVIPALLIVVPILIRSPLAFQWYMRQRVLRWYRIMHDIERRAQAMSVAEIDAELEHLDELEHKISDELVVTNTYMPQVYMLREHIEFVAAKLQKRKTALQQNDVMSQKDLAEPPGHNPADVTERETAQAAG